MKFFKTARPLSADDEHALARLAALANRVKSPRPIEPEAEQQPTSTDQPFEPLEMKEVLQ